ncbi:NBR1-Ig-like domain-containing protein [Pseudomonas sp. RIT-To-2]|uniref:NBR1-Ig-like domain-containing protein n=1 Tax=Pseudomonas sp. RIT-To-2 TaxID=3462541 RepID=UPI0024130A45
MVPLERKPELPVTIKSLEPLNSLIARRSRQLGKSMSTVAKDAGISRTYLYGLASGASQDPSVRTLTKLAKALQVSPILMFRYFADLVGARASSSSLAPTNRGVGTSDKDDIALFTADVTVADHTVVLPGEVFRKTWELQNAGSRPWRGRRLVRVDGDYVIARRSVADGSLEVVMDAHLASLYREIPLPDTLPGHPVQLSIEFAAPKETCTVASIWRIEDDQGNPCYGRDFILHAIVTVMAF